MDIKKQLPYLFKDDSIGAQTFQSLWYPLFSLSPDYEDFKKSKPYRSENDCVCVLIGQLLTYPLYEKLLENTATTIGNLPEVKEWCQMVINLFHEIQETLEIGKQSKDLNIKARTDKDADIPFQYSIYYDRFQFLQWMEKYDFPIPQELRYKKNKAGEYQWIGQREIRADLFAIYVAKATQYCAEIKAKTKQGCTKDALYDFLDKELGNNNQSFSKRKSCGRITQTVFREILKKIPPEFRRPVGAKTLK